MNFNKLKHLLAEDIAVYSLKPTLPVFIKRYFKSPGFARVVKVRFSQWFYGKGWWGRQVARRIHLHNIAHGCHISPLSNIDGGFCLPHPIGVVIGDGAVLKKNTTIFQNVTIGQRNNRSMGYPTLEDGATLYAGCCVIGPIRIGKNAVVGANAVVAVDVPDDHSATGNPAVIKPLRTKS